MSRLLCCPTLAALAALAAPATNQVDLRLPAAAVRIDTTSSSTAVGDLDRDGLVDLVAEPPGGLSAFRGLAPNALEEGVPIEPLYGFAQDVLITDLDGDTLLDVLALYDTDVFVGTPFVIHQQQPNGHFLRTEALLDVGDSQLAVVDLDGDGARDLLATSRDHDMVFVFHGPFDPLSTRPDIGLPTGDHPTRTMPGDLDLDGDPDLVTHNAFSDDITVVENLGGGYVGVGTALFYEPLICEQINAGIADYLDRHGLASVTELVGSLRLEQAPMAACG